MIYQDRAEYLSVKTTKNNNYLSHIHRQIEIFYVLDGAIEVTISGQKKRLEKGMASIVFPNAAHETYTPQASTAVMMSSLSKNRNVPLLTAYKIPNNFPSLCPVSWTMSKEMRISAFPRDICMSLCL